MQQREGGINKTPERVEVPTSPAIGQSADNPPIVQLPLERNAFRSRFNRGEDPWPDVTVGPVTVHSTPVHVVLEALAEEIGISITYESSDLIERKITAINLAGRSRDVVRRICTLARVSCRLKDGNLELSAKATYVVELPPALTGSGDSGGSSGGGDSGGAGKGDSGGGANSIVTAINNLIGMKEGSVSIDTAAGLLTYETDIEGQAKVEQYLEQLRNGRPLIVLQMHIWEVKLDENAETGIKWNKLALGTGGTSGFSLTERIPSVSAGGFALGAVVAQGMLNADVIANFLRSQGAVQNVVRPQINFISGTKSELFIGNKEKYVSQIGQMIPSGGVLGAGAGALVPGATAATGIGTNTVQTETLETGTRIKVQGGYQDGTLVLSMNLTIKELIEMGSASTGAQTIMLPKTAERTADTLLRLRPGDAMLLSGMNQTRDEQRRNSVPGTNSRLPVYNKEQGQTTEIVLLVRPTIITFYDRGAPSPSGSGRDGAAGLIIPDPAGLPPLPADSRIAPPAFPRSAPAPQPANPTDRRAEINLNPDNVAEWESGSSEISHRWAQSEPPRASSLEAPPDEEAPSQQRVQTSLVPSDPAINISQIPAGQGRRQRVIFTNTSDRNVEIRNVQLVEVGNVALSKISDDCTEVQRLEPRQRCSILANITPSSEGPFSAEVVITHDGPERLTTVRVSGTAVSGNNQGRTIDQGLRAAEQQRTGIEFGTAKNDQPISRTVLVRNVTREPIIIQTVHLIEPPPGLTIRDGGCKPTLTMAPDDACPVTMIWVPQKNGEWTAEVLLSHDGPGRFMVVPVKGMAQGLPEPEAVPALQAAPAPSSSPTPQAGSSENSRQEGPRQDASRSDPSTPGPQNQAPRQADDNQSNTPPSPAIMTFRPNVKVVGTIGQRVLIEQDGRIVVMRIGSRVPDGSEIIEVGNGEVRLRDEFGRIGSATVTPGTTGPSGQANRPPAPSYSNNAPTPSPPAATGNRPGASRPGQGTPGIQIPNLPQIPPVAPPARP